MQKRQYFRWTIHKNVRGPGTNLFPPKPTAVKLQPFAPERDSGSQKQVKAQIAHQK